MHNCRIVKCFMKLLFTILLLLNTGLCFGQEFSYPINSKYPAINKEGKTVNDFVPKGWKLLKSTSNDLNNDKKADFAFVIQRKDSIMVIYKNGEYLDTVITQPRMLLIAFTDPATSKLKLVEQNTSFILNHENANQDDPLQSIKINSKGVLQIDYHIFYSTGTWYVTDTSYKFRYQSNEFVLIGADYRSFHRASGDYEEASYNFLTKRWSMKKGTEKPGNKPVTEWKDLNLKQLKTLKTLRQPFKWQVTEGIYI